jgi:hypothetical protein
MTLKMVGEEKRKDEMEGIIHFCSDGMCTARTVGKTREKNV